MLPFIYGNSMYIWPQTIRKMDDDSFLDPNFSVDDWINSHIQIVDGKDSEYYEKNASDLLKALQKRSSSISDNANQNIQDLVDILPQSMAKMKHISNTVNDLSTSLRSLTNSGYKFKADNDGTNNINELTHMKERKDRLKDAADKLQKGIQIESDVAQLQQTSSTGDLKNICEKYSTISSSADFLSAISKFGTIKTTLEQIQITLKSRIMPQLESSCSLMNTLNFATYSDFCHQIGLKTVVLQTIYKVFKDQIESKIRKYDSDQPLSITDWLKPCLQETKQYMSTFSEWTKLLTTKPRKEIVELREKYSTLPILSIKTSIITDELFRLYQVLISPSIDRNMMHLISTSNFDDLVSVFTILTDFGKEFSNLTLFQDSKSRVQSHFRDALKDFLYSDIKEYQKTMPKSNTQNNLYKSSRQISSISADSLNEESMSLTKSNYDPQLIDKSLSVSIRAINWIAILSNDQIDCLLIVHNYIEQIIQIQANELKLFYDLEWRKLTLPKSAHLDVNNKQTLFITQLINDFIGIDKIEKKLKSFESKAKKFDLNYKATSLQPVIRVIEERILIAMPYEALKLLTNLHQSSEWQLEIQSDSNDEISTLDQSAYIKEISTNFIQLLDTITNINSLPTSVGNKWMSKTVETVDNSYINEIAHIPRFSKRGLDQLKTDIEYYLNFLGCIMQKGGDVLQTILRILQAEPGNRLEIINTADVLSFELKDSFRKSLMT